MPASLISGTHLSISLLTSCRNASGDRWSGGGRSAPISAKRLLIVVADINAARADLIGRGVEVSEVFHLDGGPVPGPDPKGRSYQTYASSNDPDGNGWLLQEIKTRLPGRQWDD